MPWQIEDYDATGIVTPGMDHIGFKVENVETFAEHMKTVTGSNAYLAPMPLGGGKEGAARLELLRRSGGGKLQIADPGAVWIDITDA
jgi:hypothetical protein